MHAVFSDVKLPGNHSGVDLAEIIRRDYRHIKVLLTSAVAPFAEVEGVTLLRKPYFLLEVERQLRSMLRIPGSSLSAEQSSELKQPFGRSRVDFSYPAEITQYYCPTGQCVRLANFRG